MGSWLRGGGAGVSEMFPKYKKCPIPQAILSSPAVFMVLNVLKAIVLLNFQRINFYLHLFFIILNPDSTGVPKLPVKK